MKDKHRGATIAAAAEAEQWAFGVPVAFGRAWKASYLEARRTHTIFKAIEIANAVAAINETKARKK